MSDIVKNKKMEFANRFRTARQYASLTQSALAERVGITQTAIHKLESGCFRSSRRTVEIALACHVNPVWLQTGEGEMLPDKNLETSGTMNANFPEGGLIPQLNAMEKNLESILQSLVTLRRQIRRLRERKRIRMPRSESDTNEPITQSHSAVQATFCMEIPDLPAPDGAQHTRADEPATPSSTPAPPVPPPENGQSRSPDPTCEDNKE
ncbi:MAG: helix-turn-helix transcriptional regulator [Magnetococcales bacterium]|nr:helix-turn-helix transcriptional regulator [Magnetococcales bacterium]